MADLVTVVSGITDLEALDMVLAIMGMEDSGPALDSVLVWP